MLSTAILLIVLALFFAIAVLLQAVFLRLGVQWATRTAVTFRKSLLIAILLQIVSIPFAIFGNSLAADSPQQEISIALGALLLQVVVSCAIVARGFGLTFLRGVQAWLPTLIPGFAMLAFLTFIHRPFVSEAFVVPSNSMAPTILGHHVTASCPRCGAPAYTAVPDPRVFNPSGELVMICSNELQPCTVQKFSETGGPDRILVNKLVTPRRWDLVVFRLPSDPSITYVKRLVGLPGEELQIKDGAVWINGEKLEPPEDIRKIEYLSNIEFNNQAFEAAGKSPIKLADDEYFVLGDFSAQAFDSRFWEVGAAGHAPYAVPKSHVIGVVTHTFWPIARWRAFR